MKRVAPRQVIVLCEPDEISYFWLTDYFPELLEPLSETESLNTTDIQACLDVVSVEQMLIPHDCSDGFLGSYWRRPHAYLDPQVRAGTSPLAQLSYDAVSRGVAQLSRDLDTGTWDTRNADFLELSEVNAGYRMITSENR